MADIAKVLAAFARIGARPLTQNDLVLVPAPPEKEPTMTATPLKRRPIPFETRLQFQDRIRLAVNTVPDQDPGAVCRAACEISTLYPWAGARDVANELVNVLAPGWGAIYLHWVATGRTS